MSHNDHRGDGDALPGGKPRVEPGLRKPVAKPGPILTTAGGLASDPVRVIRPADVQPPTAKLAIRIHPLDRVQEILFPILVVFGPATWGVVEAWSTQVVQAIVAAMVGLLLLRVFLQPSVQPVLTWLYVPVVLMLGWTGLQMLPLPRGLVEAWSPLTASLWAAVPADMNAMTFTVYPLATERLFAVLLVASCVFLVAANVYRTPPQVARLLLCVVIVGGAVAGLGIAQSFLGGDRVYWFVPPTHGNSGPFMNHNHYAQYLNLTLAAALGLLVLAAMRRRCMTQVAAASVLIGFMVIVAVGVALSSSRGGFGAMAVAGLVGAFALARSWRTAVAALLVVSIGGAIVVGAALHLGGGAVKRISNFTFAKEAASERLIIWEGAWRTFERFPGTGTGLGTFEFVYPMFGERTPHRITYADNDYLQLLAECGLVGAAIVAAFLLLLAGELWRVYRSNHGSMPLAWVARALSLAILAVALQSATDFAQRLPGIAVLTATYCGIVIAAAAASRPPKTSATLDTGRARARLVFAGGLVLALGLFAWTLTNADRDRRAESLWNIAEVRRAELARQRWQGTNPQYAALISPAAQAVEIQPRDMRYQYWLAVFRWRSISRVTDRRGNVVTTPRTREIARRIADDFLQTTTLCPTAPRTWLMAARIKILVLDDPAGFEHARQAQLVNPSGQSIDALLKMEEDE